MSSRIKKPTKVFKTRVKSVEQAPVEQPKPVKKKSSEIPLALADGMNGECRI